MSRKQSAEPAAPPPPVERSVLDLVLEIRAGTADPRHLSAQDRQACVAHLTGEGLSVPEIAQFLKRNERTITRDRKAIQELAALDHDPKLAGQMAGQLVTEAMLCIDRIRRVSRDRETPPAVKVDAERSCFQILTGLVERLQSMGYLPTAAQKLDLTHSVGEIPSMDAIVLEVQRIKSVAEFEFNEMPPELKALEDTVTRAALAAKVESAAAAPPKETLP